MSSPQFGPPLHWRERRLFAPIAGIGAAAFLFCVVYSVLLVVGTQNKDDLTDLQYWSYLLPAGIITLVGALIARFVARLFDKRNYAVQRAVSLPLHWIEEGDLVWLEGVVKADSPIKAPQTEEDAVFYEYDGSKATARCWLEVAGSDTRINLDLEAFNLQHLRERSGQVGEKKWTMDVLNPNEQVSVVGRATLQGGAIALQRIDDSHKPILTRRSRKRWTEGVEALERQIGIGGLAAAFIGAFIVMLALIGKPGDLAVGSIVGAIVGVVVMIPLVIIGMLNRFNTMLGRLHEAWAWVQEDLDTRAALASAIVTGLEVKRDEMTAEEQALLDEHKKSTEDDATSAKEAAAAAASKGALDIWAVRLSAQNTLAKLSAPIAGLAAKYIPDHADPGKFAALENEIAYDRTTFNAAVGDYNKVVTGFPAGLFASMLGFKPAPIWQAIPDA